MKKNKLMLTDETYYSLEADKAYCSASQYLDFIGRPSIPGCEARAMAKLKGEFKEETTKAMLIGSILDTLWELDDMPLEEKVGIIADKFPECVSTRGNTKGELKSEYKQAIQLYQRSLSDKLFCKFMSGKKQVIMTGEIGGKYILKYKTCDNEVSEEFNTLYDAKLRRKTLKKEQNSTDFKIVKEVKGLPFKIKMDSYIPKTAIVDLKTTQDASIKHRKYIADSGNWETFYRSYGYDIQLAIYREIVRQNTGKTLRCYICAIDKKDHPLPQIIELSPKVLDDALLSVKANAEKIKMLKKGKVKDYLRCEECDYCRDTYKCKVLSSEEFEVRDF